MKADVYIGDPSDYARHGESLEALVPEKSSGALRDSVHGSWRKRQQRRGRAHAAGSSDSKLKIETIETSKAPKPFSHEPQAIKVGNLLFLSQQMPCDEKGVLPAGMHARSELPVLRPDQSRADAVHAQKRRGDL